MLPLLPSTVPDIAAKLACAASAVQNIIGTAARAGLVRITEEKRVNNHSERRRCLCRVYARTFRPPLAPRRPGRVSQNVGALAKLAALSVGETWEFKDGEFVGRRDDLVKLFRRQTQRETRSYKTSRGTLFVRLE